MKLVDWLAARGLTHADFGKRIGRSSEAVRLLVNGARSPSRRTAADIFRETDGQVTPNDFMTAAPAPQDAAE